MLQQRVDMLVSGSMKMLMEFWLALAREIPVVIVKPAAEATPKVVRKAMAKRLARSVWGKVAQ